MAKSYNSYTSQFNYVTDSPSWGVSSSASTMLSDAMGKYKWSQFPQVPYKRSGLSKAFDAILAPNYAVAGAADALVRGTNPVKGLVEGFLSGADFISDTPVFKHKTFSDVLESSGWKPTTGAGRFAKGATGLLLDVALDPTTYITGGTSALFKGTGQASARVAGRATAERVASKYGLSSVDDITKLSEQVYESVIKKQTERGISESLAQRFAMSESKKVIDEIAPFVNGMNSDIATKIITSHAKKNGLTVSAEQLASDVEKLTNKYNKAIGLNMAPRGATLSLGNAPLINKLFPKKAQAASIQLATGENIARLSDRIGASTIYANVRNSIYTSRLGKLFSTKSGMYKLAQTSPEQFYDVVKFMDTTQGLNVGKVQKEAMIFEKVKHLKNLTPAEQESVIKALQDKRTFKQVWQMIKFADTQEAEIHRVTLQRNREVAQVEIKKIIQESDDIAKLTHATDEGLLNAKAGLEPLRDEYRKKLVELRGMHNLDIADKEKLMKSLIDEANDINIYDAPTAKRVSQGEFDEALIKEVGLYHGNWRTQEKAFKEHMKQADEIKGLMLDIPKYSDDMPQAMKDIHAQGVEYNKALSKEIQLVKDSAPSRAMEREALVGKLGEYLFNDVKGISPSTFDKHLEDLVEMVNKGSSKESILYHIEKNADFYSGRAANIYPFIANKIGYGSGTKYASWKEYYFDRVEKFDKLLRTAERGSRQYYNAYDELLKLNQAKLYRDMWLNQFRKAKTNKEVMKIISDDVDKQMYDDLAKMNDPELQRTRDKIADDMRAKEGREYADLKDNTEYNAKLTSVERDELFNNILDASNIKDVNVGTMKWISLVTEQAELVLKNIFKKPFDKLSEAQQVLFYKLSFQNAMNSKAGKPIISALGKDAADMSKKVFQQAEMARIGELQRKVRLDSEIYFKEGTNPVPHKGTVMDITKADGATSYKVLTSTGKEMTVTPAMIRKVVIGDVKKSGDDLVAESALATNEIEKKMSLFNRVNDIKTDLALSKLSFGINRGKFIDEYIERTQNLGKIAGEMEAKKHDLKRAFDDVEWDKVDTLARDIRRYDDILDSDDALETYAETLAKGSTYEARQRATLTAGIMLDTYDNIDDRIKDIIKTLRADFIDMGKAEVGAGKLSVKAFETNMLSYLPHVMTDVGQRFIEKNVLKFDKLSGKVIAVPRNVKKDGTYISQDMGYGTVWNEFGQDRTIKSVFLDGEWIRNPSIAQINESVAHLLQGKNLFSENIADIYLTRALKSNDLLYDNDYMHNMLFTFGKEFKPGKPLEAGYKTVMNYGKYKDVANKLPSAIVSMDISDAVTDFVVAQLDAGVRVSSKEMEEMIGQFMKENFPPETVTGMFNKYQEGFYRYAGMNKKNFEATAVPMLELEARQAESIVDYHKSVITEVGERIEATRVKLAKWEANRGSHPDYLEVIEKYKEKIAGLQDRITGFDGALVRNVNDVIVGKANQARQVQFAKDANRFLKVYDKFTHLIKLNMTTVMPAFHARNKMANVFLNWLGVGADALSPTAQKNAWKAVWHKGDSEKIKGRFVIKQGDAVESSMSYSDAYMLAKQHGVIDEGFFAKDIGAGAQSSGLVGGRLDPTDTKDFILYRKGAEVGSQIENSDRFLHFVARLKTGAKPEEAAESVNKYLFDYSDLTQFEQNVMKRVLPFYTFMRKNGETQLRALLSQPGKYQTVAKLINGVEGMNNEEDRLNMGLVNDFAKDWIKTPLSTINPEGFREPILVNPNMPFQEFSRIPNPLHPIESVLNLFTQTNPLLKVPIEQTLNHNTYFNQPITSKTGNHATERLDHLAGQSALYNAGKDLTTKSGGDLGYEILANTTGIKALSYDYEGLKNLALRDYYQGQALTRGLSNAYKRLMGE